MNPSAAPSPPAKHVLVLRYSQSGQLDAIVDRILAPLLEGGAVRVHEERLVPLDPHPYPWSLRRFFDTFPETALMCPEPLAPLTLTGAERFDLAIVPYQVWFLAPSLPVSSALQLPALQRVLAGTPVVTVIGCRNMWLMAQQHMQRLLAAAGARLIDNVVLTDPSPMAASLITTPLWLLTGRREGWFGLPPAGVAAADIERARRFGLALADALAADRERGTAPLLAGLDAVRAQVRFWPSERAATRSFQLWGRLLHAAGRRGAPQRVPLLVLYVLVLLTLILTVLPVSTLIHALIRPWRRARQEALRARFEGPSGSGRERLGRYESR